MTNYQLNMERIRQGTFRNKGCPFLYLLQRTDWRLQFPFPLSLWDNKKGRPQYQFVKGTWNKCAAFALLCRESPLINGSRREHDGTGGLIMHFYQFPLITFLYPWHDINHKDSPYPVQTICGTAHRPYIRISMDTWNRPTTNSPLWEMGIGGKWFCPGANLSSQDSLLKSLVWGVKEWYTKDMEGLQYHKGSCLSVLFPVLDGQ